MADQFEDLLAGFDVPDANRSVFAGGDRLQTIGAKRDRMDSVAVSDERSLLFAGRHAVHEVDRHDVPFMTLQRAPQRPVVGRVQVQRVVVSGRSEPAAIGAEGHADDRLLGTDQRNHDRSQEEVPDAAGSQTADQENARGNKDLGS